MPPVEPARPTGSSRPLPRGLLILAAALLVARIGTGIYEHQHPPVPGGAGSSAPSPSPSQGQAHAAVDFVAWVPAEQAESESRRTGKPILYEFSAEWCGPCKMLANDVFADPAAASQITQMFVPVHVVDRQQEEGRNPPAIERLQSAYSINGFPTLVVARPGITNYESKDGYMGRTRTLKWLAVAAVKMRGDGPGASVDSTIHP